MNKLKHKIICYLLRNRRVNFIELEQMKDWAEKLYSNNGLRRGFDFYQENRCYITGYGYIPIRIRHYYELKERYDYFNKTGKIVV